MNPRLEHANLVVRDLDAIADFIGTAFPDFRIRHAGENGAGHRWLHLGTDDTYIALSEATQESLEPWQPYSGKVGLNHLGYEVADAAALRKRLLEAGYEESTVPNDHPHRTRVYFHDPEGNDWEFVQYFSEKAEERNDYDS
jgi:catechol 2,3-dioxygenase-like lactoylglutathione lyase family enzyme